ncbi:amino acid adenylation domain-containing protein [Echinicola sp. CAU 1574]|uniref:Amino acid adenylation domain-containing protein n=1 Tax=Echinicola arenosa TaxID=2774144 RepID=A0ABR9AH42_9BACT|nr:non-ribosomal peptide synthetase [Echinicola arenosa]MBD8487637.1 amino acid adenylation domain-containing protein [Echinicola arenosa]
MNPSFEFKEIDFDPFENSPLIKAIPSIDPQKEIWMACKLGGEVANMAYNESISLVLNGNLDTKIFKSSILEIVNRHEALRSTFSTDGKTMCIHERLIPDHIDIDLTEKSDNNQKKFISEFKQKDASTPFDLENGPLLRTALFKLSNEIYHFTLTIHHIIGDGWSLGVILEDLSKIYSAKVLNGTPNLLSADLFSEYSREIETIENQPDFKKTENFWLELFGEQKNEFTLPTDFQRPENKIYKSKRLDFQVSKTKIEQLKSIGQSTNTSLVNTLIAAFEVFLAKKTKQQDIILGVPAAGQSATGFFNLVGHCVNLLPLKSTVQKDLPFLDYLKNRNGEILDCYDHQLFTFSKLLAKLNIKRDLSKTPLVPVIFNLDVGMDANVKFYDIDYSLISNPREYDNFELALNLTNSKDSFQFEWTYNTSLFKEESIQNMMDEFNRLLDGIIQNPSQKISDYTIFDYTQILDQLQVWNNTSTDYPKDRSFLSFFSEMALKHADKTAVEFQSQKISYKELEEQSNKLAHYLTESNIRKGDRIGLFLPRSIDMVLGLLGISKCGAIYIPIDPELPEERVTHMMSDAQASALITTSELGNKLNTNIEKICIEDFYIKSKDLSKKPIETQIDPADPVYILYTSGSTGKPKGVQVSHQNLTNFLLSTKDKPGVNESERILAITTISFDVAGAEIFSPLINGATLIMADSITIKDGRLLLKTLKEKNITMMFSTPATYRMLIQVGWDQPLPIKITSGGEPFQSSLVEKLLKVTKEIWNAYGPTETTIFSTINRITSLENYTSIGRPIANTQIYILDQDLRPVSPGAIGEIYIGGDGVSLGYWNRPDLNRERFINNPLSNSVDVLYKSGDLGKFLSNGEIICLGREDSQVKIRGHRIEIGEVEQQIANLDYIDAASVIVDNLSNGAKKMIAYVILKNKKPLNESSESELDKAQHIQIKDDLKKFLPEYMIPTEWVSLSHFPLTPNGKIDYKALPVPSKSVDSASVTDKQARTENEKLVSDIWLKSLGLPYINLDDDFFELGGHSILAVEVMSQIDKATGKNLPLTSLFKHSTIRTFSKLLDDESEAIAQEKEWTSLIPIKSSGRKPPVYLIHGVAANITNYFKLIDFVDEDQPLYGLQAKGLNGIDKPNHGIESIAKYYVHEIIAHNPQGPYNIGGYSFGGYVAFEMAAQLIKMGKKVNKLIIFDTSVEPEDLKSNNRKNIIDSFGEELEQRKVDLQLLFKAPNTFRTTKARAIKRKTENFLQKIGLSKEDEQPKERAAIIKMIKKINNDSLRNYSLYPIDLELTLFKAAIKIAPVKDEKTYGWSPYVKKVNVIDIEGDHNSMFDPPFGAPFAKKLQKLLDEN